MRDYIEERRLWAALCLLRLEEPEIGSIALSVGYANYNTFNRAFQRIVGCTPSAFRVALDDVQRRDYARPGARPERPPRLSSAATSVLPGEVLVALHAVRA